MMHRIEPGRGARATPADLVEREQPRTYFEPAHPGMANAHSGAIACADETGTFRLALEGDESGALLIGGDDDGR